MTAAALARGPVALHDMLGLRCRGGRGTSRGRTRALFTIDVANTVFVVCLAVGGILLLVTVLLDDILGGLLDWMHVDFDLGGVPPMPLLLAFLAVIGRGGVIGTLGPGLRDRP